MSDLFEPFILYPGSGMMAKHTIGKEAAQNKSIVFS
jgi:hypothetical protein